MKILVLGAGAIGGYFGGRLVQAGADLAFLVRERRAAQLREHGLVVRSPHGDFTLPARSMLREQIDAPADLVLLACKAYDLDAAIDAITPAVGPSTTVLPLLNGLSHVDRLRAVFGPARVAGGSCGIPATLTPEGAVVQLGAFHRIAFGVLPGTATDTTSKLEQLRALFAATPVDVELSTDMMRALWGKFVGLATLAAMTCLMRSSVGDILNTDDGAALVAEAYDACERTARSAGYAPREHAMAPFKTMLADRTSPMTASMLRDLEGGGRTEGAHIVGDMLSRARAAGVPPGPLVHAWCHLQAAERRRLREAG
ncbi:MAG: ketopantoate reductase family protein [Aquincola sp.]|nr:ketopantoate reductase family protein [Aquincola sp.]MDH4290305.1 ketopantoate reductase family protein [Aquincola sp.]